ncbi:MAG: hypothetical protein NC037_02590 [Bacteroides sp.]|nr:hypothetical protein [Bacillota bacterium]MCM1393415.1 hypothetical protein [[Eubacterium] siraeum]MCM1455401.1 hypothetical protein [Bacteroides sp.]
MNIFDVENSVVSADDLHDGIDFVSEFSAELKQYDNRITGSKSETACARTIRRRLADETGATVRLEAYKAYPLLGRGSVPILGIWYILCYVLYFVSFAGKGVAGILLTLLALGVYAVGAIAMILMYVGKRRLRGLYSQKISYNVVSEFSKNKDKLKKERIFIVADNHDATLGNSLKDYNLVSKLAHVFVPLTAIVFVLACIVKMAIGADTSAKITVLSVIPGVIGVLGIAVTLLRFSPFERHAKQNNGVATSIAMATYAYFVEQPQLLDDDVRIVYASFGGENSAHGGSEAFVKAHPEFKGAHVFCIGDIEGGDLKIADMNAVRKIRYSTPLVSAIRSSAHEQKIDISVLPTDKISQRLASVHGYMPDAFALNGDASAMLLAHKPDEHELDLNDLEKIFSVTVGTMIKLMKDTPVSQDAGEEQKIKTNNSDMEIHAAVGK